MYLSSQDFIRALLLKEDAQYQKSIRESILPLLEESSASLTRKLCTLMVMVEDCHGKLLTECLQHIEKSFSKTVAVLEEYDIAMPEEEVKLESVVKNIQEEGEGGAPATSAPTNVTAGIEASVPRIYPKNKKKVADVAPE